jgi:hypothetical protein
LASEPPEEEEGNSGSEPERSAEYAAELCTYEIERCAESAMELGTYGKERRRRAERGVESPTVLGTHAMELGTYGMERGAESAMELGKNEMANGSPCRGGISCTATENPLAEVRC